MSAEEEAVESGAIEERFREHVAEALLSMDIPPFDAKSLEPARSEKEIAKCKLLVEKAQKRREIRLRESVDHSARPKRSRKLSKASDKDRNAFAPLRKKRSNSRRRK